ncbi:MAG: M15 family metallopeptidase, partial [Pseudolabrys sp.]
APRRMNGRRPSRAGFAGHLRVTGLALYLAFASTPGPAAELPAGFASLRDVAPDIRQDMRYATANNFTGRPLPGYDAGECVLKRAVAAALARVQADLAREGLTLKVYDCYRPMRAVRAMARWAADSKAAPDTSRFYPGLDKRKLFALGYISSTSAHARGVAVDLTLVPRDAAVPPPFDPAARYGSCAGPAAARAPDDGLDMGTGYDCFSAKSASRDESIGAEARANRRRLLAAMARHGFSNYRREWWHFSYPAADTRQVYDFPISAK